MKESRIAWNLTYINLIPQTYIREPALDETIMSVASHLALQSSCIQRRVGAVLRNKEGFMVSAAYNEVPRGEKSCSESVGDCYRTVIRRENVKKVVSAWKYCPYCLHILPKNFADLVCPSCGKLYIDEFHHYKLLDKCRAIHAEEAVIIGTSLRADLREASLYSTTFPCMQCAKRIIDVGIAKVIYIDPYSDPEAIEFLERGGVKTRKFEGVKAQVYYRLFHRRRDLLEKGLIK